MKKHLKTILGLFLFILIILCYAYLIDIYPNVMMWISLTIIVILLYCAFYKMINN